MEYKDRRAGLVVFGIVQILIGLCQGSMGPLMLVGSLAGGNAPGALPTRMVVPIGLLYLSMGAVFVTLGIGSLMVRRWARALTLVLSWIWLIIGVTTTVVLAVMLPRLLASLPPDQASAKPFIIGCISLMLGLIFILLPLAFVLFYRSPNVKATVEARDPVRRWTDDIPLPLIGYGVMMIGGAVWMLFYGFMFPALPLGPWMLRGAAMPVFVLGVAAMMLFIGIGMLKRMKAAWWAALVMLAVGAGVTALMSKTDFAAYYREIGMAADPRQIEMMRTMYSPPFVFIWMGAMWSAYIAFLLYLRRYIFVRT